MLKYHHKKHTPFPETERIKDEIVKEFGEGLGKIILEAFRDVYDDLVQLEKLEQVDSLPIADSTKRGKWLLLKGASGVADKIYICIKNTLNQYVWMEK